MNALEAVFGFLAVASYFAGMVFIISSILSRIKTNLFLKICVGFVLFFILNIIPFNISFSLAYDFLQVTDTVRMIISTSITIYVSIVAIIGIGKVSRDYYLLYKKKSQEI